MIKIENVLTPSAAMMETVIRGMRNPKNSWDRSDSKYIFPTGVSDEDLMTIDPKEIVLGEKDKNLMMRLVSAGAAHAKYKRMMWVYADITASHTWWAEMDTYEFTVRDSCSKMHTIHVKPFSMEDFDHEGIDACSETKFFEAYIEELEFLRQKFNETQEKRYWRALIEMLPLGFRIKATLMLNYETLTAIYRWRRNHKVEEWNTFCKWIETLPYSELITEAV